MKLLGDRYEVADCLLDLMVVDDLFRHVTWSSHLVYTDHRRKRHRRMRWCHVA